MKKQLNQVLDFHKGFGCHIEVEPIASPSQEVTDVRARLIQEELDEYREAVADGDLVRVADALSDLMYVLLGTYIAHGLYTQAEALFDEVHRSNMSKLDEDGRPILREDGKILKPDSWSPPNLVQVLQTGP
jgi:predicted HAD superfamily Cof-like phosphohydrolase